ncbi:MAG: HEAT repeat domain-containing protein [Gemmataceae bacterium]
MCPLPRWLWVAAVWLGCSLAGVAVPPLGPNEIAEDERLLRAAQVEVDGEGLLRFFRQLTPTEDVRQRLAEHVARLGADEYAEREQATRELIAAGPSARPILTQALRSADLEIRRRAQFCLNAIERHHTPAQIEAAARLLRLRHPEGTTADLLAYLPFAENEQVEEEVVFTLLSINSQALDPALLAAARDMQSARRAAAALVISCHGSADQRRLARPLLADPEAKVRWRAAQGWLYQKEDQALPVLLRLLKDAPLPIAREAHQLLRHVAGPNAPDAAPEADAEQRLACHAAWQAWWLKTGQTVNWDGVNREELLVNPIQRAKQAAERALTALTRGTLTDFQQATDVPFFMQDNMFANRDQLDQLFKLLENSDERKQMHFQLKQVEHLSRSIFSNQPKLPDFLKQHPTATFYLVHVDLINGNQPEHGALIIRCRGSQARAVGFIQIP